MIELVVFDLAGTTVDDNINGLPLVTVAMTDAFTKHGYDISPSQIDEVRGMEKKEAIAHILSKVTTESSTTLVEKIFKDFRVALEHNLNLINNEIKGTTQVFHFLSKRGVKIALGSGFPQAVVENIVKCLNWSDMVDFVSSAEKIGKGRPDPALILSAMEKFSILDARKVIKVGDTKIDVEEGKNAGCWTVAVLTGTQKLEFLKEAHPDFIVNSVQDLPRVISQIEDSH